MNHEVNKVLLRFRAHMFRKNKERGEFYRRLDLVTKRLSSKKAALSECFNLDSDLDLHRMTPKVKEDLFNLYYNRHLFKLMKRKIDQFLRVQFIVSNSQSALNQSALTFFKKRKPCKTLADLNYNNSKSIQKLQELPCFTKFILKLDTLSIVKQAEELQKSGNFDQFCSKFITSSSSMIVVGMSPKHHSTGHEEEETNAEHKGIKYMVRPERVAFSTQRLRVHLSDPEYLSLALVVCRRAEGPRSPMHKAGSLECVLGSEIFDTKTAKTDVFN